jgi:hypothetical protein
MTEYKSGLVDEQEVDMASVSPVYTARAIIGLHWHSIMISKMPDENPRWKSSRAEDGAQISRVRGLNCDHCTHRGHMDP